MNVWRFYLTTSLAVLINSLYYMDSEHCRTKFYFIIECVDIKLLLLLHIVCHINWPRCTIIPAPCDVRWQRYFSSTCVFTLHFFPDSHKPVLPPFNKLLWKVKKM